MNATSEESFLVLKKFMIDPPTVQVVFAWGVSLPLSRTLVFRTFGKVTAANKDESFVAITDESTGTTLAIGAEDWSFEFGTSNEAPAAELTALLKPLEEVDELVIGRSPYGAIVWIFTLKSPGDSSAV